MSKQEFNIHVLLDGIDFALEVAYANGATRLQTLLWILFK